MIRQSAVEAVKEEIPQARRSRGRTEWVPSGLATRQKQGRRLRSRPWDSRRGDSTPSGWSRGTAGPECRIKRRRRRASDSGYVRRRVRVGMGPEDGKTVRDAGLPGGEAVPAHVRETLCSDVTIQPTDSFTMQRARRPRSHPRVSNRSQPPP